MTRIEARLLDRERVPLAGVIIRVVGWSLDGGTKTLAEGESDPEGALALEVELAGDGLLPRLGLRAQHDADWHDLSDSPASLSLDRIDFGTLVVADEPLAWVGDRSLYAMSEATFASLEAPTPKIAESEELTALEQELAATKEASAALEQELAAVKEASTALEQELAEQQPVEADTTALVDVVSGVGEQLGTAAKTLEQSSLGVVLGEVSVTLKGVGTSGGSSFTFPTVSELGQIGAELSTIDLAFHPAAPTATATADVEEGPQLPSLLGYTELLARRKLEPLRVALEVSHKAVAAPASGPSPYGRVVEQSPAPGTPISRGARVEILIGKAIEGEG